MKKKTWHQILAGNVARKCFLKCDIKAFIETLSNWVIIWQWWNYEWFIFSSVYFSVFSKIGNKYKLLLWSIFHKSPEVRNVQIWLIWWFSNIIKGVASFQISWHPSHWLFSCGWFPQGWKCLQELQVSHSSAQSQRTECPFSWSFIKSRKGFWKPLHPLLPLH